MFERFTADTRDAVIAAQTHARQLEATEIGARHLLLALGDDPAAGALLADHGVTTGNLGPLVRSSAASEAIPGVSAADADALRRFGIDIDHVAESVKEHFATTPPQHARTPNRRRGLLDRLSGDHIPFTTEAKQALENCLKVALRLRHNSLTSLHLLAGLLEPGQREAPDLLRASGVDPATLRAAVEDRLRRAA